MTENTINNDMTMGGAIGTLLAGRYRVVRQLGQGGMRSDVYSWRAKADDGDARHDAQIDLLIERADRVISICELKYSGDEEYVFTRDERDKLHRRGRLFVEATNTKKTVCYVLVTTTGIRRNEYAGSVQAMVTIDDLFRG